MKRETLLMVADSEHDANMLYAVGMFVPDPFIFLQIDGKPHIIMSDLEIDRARKTSPHCKVHSLSQIQDELKKAKIENPNFSDVIKSFLRKHKIKKITVPENFPFGLASKLKDHKIKVRSRDGFFFPDRELKSPEEVKKISAALMMAEVGLAEGIQLLKRCKIGKKGLIMLNHAPLTSERLRAVIDTAIIQAGGLAANTIVAGGNQACDPHERGSGPLKANFPIILDVFPRSQKTGYFGDITRTVVKGKASDAVKKMYYTVLHGQEVAMQHIADEVKGIDVHAKVNEYFESQGFKTGKVKGRMQGFFHGTGHGVGLEIHEAPRMGKTSVHTLRAGHVVTIEPGLYYLGIGGVRLEDMAYITKNGPKNLTKFEKVLEL